MPRDTAALLQLQEELQSTDSAFVEAVYEDFERLLAKLQAYAEKLVGIREALQHWMRNDHSDEQLIRASELQEEAEAVAPTPEDLAGAHGLQQLIEERLLETLKPVEAELRAHPDRALAKQLIDAVEHVAQQWHALRAYVRRCRPALRSIDIVKAAQADRPLDELEERAVENITRVDDLIETLHPSRLGRLLAKADLGVAADAPEPQR